MNEIGIEAMHHQDNIVLPPKNEVLGSPITVFRKISKNLLPEITQKGIFVSENKRTKKNSEVESIFSKIAKKYGKPDRTKCIFAFLEDPRTMHGGLRFDPETEVIIQMHILAEGIIVAEGEYYSDAVLKYDPNNKSETTKCAEYYYSYAKPILKYLSDIKENKDNPFSFAEALIPHDILPENIKILS